jgi:hypothetical protein
MSDLLVISRLANQGAYFNTLAGEMGFDSADSISRFVRNTYAGAIKTLPAANRPRGLVLDLNVPENPLALVTGDLLRPLLITAITNSGRYLHSLKLDLSGALTTLHEFTIEERRRMSGGAWTQQTAQLISRDSKRCIVFASGVSLQVYMAGDLYLHLDDVIEELPAACTVQFQSDSWEDGGMLFQFAARELNNTGPNGIWFLPDVHVLRPKPELLMRQTLGEYLRFRLAGYSHHDEEPHVEHEGRADISLHLIDGRIYIVEVKWLGRSVTSSKSIKPKDEVTEAARNGPSNWFTEFDDETFLSGIRQLASYYTTGRYRRGYLAVFDCSSPLKSNGEVNPDPSDLNGLDPSCFRILRACVDPRSASVRSRSAS